MTIDKLKAKLADIDATLPNIEAAKNQTLGAKAVLEQLIAEMTAAEAAAKLAKKRKPQAGSQAP